MRILALVIASSAMSLQAQQHARAILEQPEIRIGEHAQLVIEVAADGGPVQWPAFVDSLAPGIEVARPGVVDTLVERRILQRRIAITGFDTGHWAIPPLKLRIGAHAVETEALLLHVTGVVLDESGAPRAEKPLIELPFSLAWWARKHATWLIAGAVIAALVAGAILFMRRKRPEPKAPEPVAERPLGERILAALRALDQQRLWQNGEHKAYQSALTDLLRGYIEERFKVPALERTTDELLQELRVSTMLPDHQALMGNMLHSADMVKFAKAVPSPMENEQLMASAVRFVQETTQTAATHP